MLVFLNLKPMSDQFRLNGRQLRRRDDNVCVRREHRCDIAIDGQTTDQTPVTVAIQNLNQQREIAASPVGDRFENFSCGHLVKQAVSLRFDTQTDSLRYSLSNIPAAPMPPPTHIVTMPYRPLRLPISRKIDAVSFAPVHPNGWPSAIAPPFTFTLSGFSSSILITASDWAAKASFSSITAMSSRVRPASFKTFGIANTGPIPISSGGHPAVAYATSRAIGFAPNCLARSSDMTIAAAAPSDICEELPAVMVPFN